LIYCTLYIELSNPVINNVAEHLEIFSEINTKHSYKRNNNNMQYSKETKGYG